MNDLSQLKERTMFRIVLLVSGVVFVLVLVLNRKVLPRPEVLPAFATFLPALNACINAACSVLLLISYRAIRAKKIDIHRRLNLLTFGLSALFIISYVAYHWMADETKFPLENPLRPLYLGI